jgi:hypothetical protein
MKIRILGVIVAALAVAMLGSGTAKAVPSSSLPDVSLITAYTEFGNQEAESLVTINGKVGVSSGGRLHVMAPSVINGDVAVASGATFQNDKADNTNIHGSILMNQNLTATQNQVASASTAFSALSADQTFSTLNSTQSFTAPAGTALVVDITNLTLNNANINFSGPGYLVLNVSGSFSLNGSAAILDSDPTHVFDNYSGSSALQTKVGDTIDGYLLIPTANASLDGTFFGGLYAGTGTITLLSGAKVGSAVPEPATASLLGLAALVGASSLVFRRKR